MSCRKDSIEVSTITVAWLTIAMYVAFVSPAFSESAPWQTHHAGHLSPGITGSWFNADRAGEGFVVQILPDDRALVIWFTYPQATGSVSASGQSWALGTGALGIDEITIDDLALFFGPSFGPGYDPEDLQSQPFGRLSLSFAGCDVGLMDHTGAPGIQSASRSLVRLTETSDVRCETDVVATQIDVRGFTGAWFNPARNGSGWLLEELDENRVNGYWFTYNDEGDPVWMTAIGTVAGDRIEFAELLRPNGTLFGDDFDSSAIELDVFGSAELTMTDCDELELQWQSIDPAFGSGGYPLTRLTLPDRVDCATTRVLHDGNWAETSPIRTPRTELSVAALDGEAFVSGGFGGVRSLESYNPADDTWTSHPDMPIGRNHHMSVGANGELYLLGGNQDDSFGRTRTAHAYNPSTRLYRELPRLPAEHAATVNAIEWEGKIYLAGGTTRAVQEYDPETDRWRIIPEFDSMLRDHSVSVRYRDAIWVLGGRSNATGVFASVSIFDLAAQQWTAGPSMRERRSGFAAGVIGGQIVAIAGEINAGADQAAPFTVNSVEFYDPNRNRWLPGPDLPMAAHGIGAAVFDDVIVVAGGSAEANSLVPDGKTFIYRPAPTLSSATETR